MYTGISTFSVSLYVMLLQIHDPYKTYKGIYLYKRYNPTS